jgi:poly(hydroxyalkanoate) granule-associated protein
MAKSHIPGDPCDRDQDGIQHQAERLARSLGQSAQQVWLAGIGALGRAQSEGNRLFDSLVQEGSEMQRDARRFTERQADTARSNVDYARGRASDGWDRLERAFESRVQRTLARMGVPLREDLAELSRRLDALTAELRRSTAGSTGRGADTSAARPAHATARKATHTSPHASPVKKATVKKAPVRKSTRRATATPGL